MTHPALPWRAWQHAVASLSSPDRTYADGKLEGAYFGPERRRGPRRRDTHRAMERDRREDGTRVLRALLRY